MVSIRTLLKIETRLKGLPRINTLATLVCIKMSIIFLKKGI